MNEKEIIEYLKENKNKGAAFAFLPEEVQSWACHHDCKIIFFKNNSWGNYPSKEDVFTPNDIIALPEDFKLEEKPERGWVEFEIDQNGEFGVDIDGDKDEVPYYWAQWYLVLIHSQSSRSNAKYTAFGGWQYAEGLAWFTTPQMKVNGYFSSTSANDDVVEPAIPIKIRFWREAKY